MSMRLNALLIAGASAFALAACSPAAEKTDTAEAVEATPAASTGQTVMVGGAEMSPSKTIVENASASADHTTLVTAVGAAGLAETLSGAGPFTVFAPTNAAFSKLPAGTVETLVKPESKAQLTTVLTYHVVPGDVSAAQLTQLISAGGGSAKLTTVQGGVLTASLEGGSVVITDAKGGKSRVTQADVDQSNGVVHVVDTVLMPQ